MILNLNDHYQAFRCHGSDAVAFLNGQLTNDCAMLPVGQGQQSGYCSAKGKLMATPLVYKVSESELIVLIHKSLAETWLKRIKMFVLRAKVQFEALTCTIFWSNTPKSNLPTFATFPLTEHIPVFLSHEPLGQLEPTQTDWHKLLIEAGIIEIMAGLEDRFIPQAIGLDKRGGVHFRKGCYPGQEVVKRAQTYGQVKKRVVKIKHDYPELLPLAGEIQLSTQVCADVVLSCAAQSLAVADPALTDGQHELNCVGLPAPVQAEIQTIN